MLYKLDGGLDHILVDEAQDTSPVQWQVIRALAEEFFSGQGAQRRAAHAVRGRRREAVDLQLPGRGARDVRRRRATSFARARRRRPGCRWQRIPLTLSFRSVEPLLAAVDRIFADPGRTPGLTAERKPVSHVANRAGHAGLVEIWPTEKHEAPEPAEPWSPLAEVERLAVRRAAGGAHRRHHPRLDREPRDAGLARAAPSAPATS